MKPNKSKTLFLASTCLFALAGCGPSAEPGISSQPAESTSEEEEPSLSSDSSTNKDFSSSKGEEGVGVVYFSATGTTKAVAASIADALSASLQEIVPLEPYTAEDLNYNVSSCRANVEQNDPSARPAIKERLNVAPLDTLFLGYPIWWGRLPKILYTFCESVSLSGKKIVPFCTSGGSGISSSVQELKTLLPNSEVKEGRRFSGRESGEQIASWAENNL